MKSQLWSPAQSGNRRDRTTFYSIAVNSNYVYWSTTQTQGYLNFLILSLGFYTNQYRLQNPDLLTVISFESACENQGSITDLPKQSTANEFLVHQGIHEIFPTL